jgi:formylglycine-generating enzyme required for sulfatase activity
VRVAGYELESEIGRGGMGAVWRARTDDGRPVAIKFLIASANADEAVKRFFREKRLLAELGEAQGFIPLLDAGSSPKGPWLAMPFLPGGTLADRLHRGPLTVQEAIPLGIALAQALGRAHAHGIVHRDMKPANVMFTAEGRPLIGDLGLAKHFGPKEMGASISLTKTGEIRGTVGYMAPEQVKSTKHVGPAADIFSLGAILYECVSGAPAFGGDSAHEVLARLTVGDLEPLDKVKPDTPRWFSRVLQKALALEPSARFPDGAAFARALEAGGSGFEISDETKLRLILAGGFGLALLVLGGGIGLSIALKPEKKVASQPATPAAPVAPAQPSALTTAPGSPPQWYRDLPPTERPAIPLPKGLVFGDEPREYKNEKDGSVLVFVPSGNFIMGADAKESASRPVGLKPEGRETPAHEVRLSAYFIGKYEVTNAQFEQFAKEKKFVTVAEQNGGFTDLDVDVDSAIDPKANRKFPRGGARPAAPDEPVVQVSWTEVSEYCKWAGLRLPTEAEWERAASWDARTQKKRLFPWGDDPIGPGTRRVANIADDALIATLGPPAAPPRSTAGYADGYAFLAPVGSFPDGASPVGCLDMGGNAHEWVEDAYAPDFYSHSPPRDPVKLDDLSLEKVFRDGSFASNSGMSRTTLRQPGAAFLRRSDLGFRVARAAH